MQKGNYDLEGKMWCRKKYWQAQFFTTFYGMNRTYGTDIVPTGMATGERNS